MANKVRLHIEADGCVVDAVVSDKETSATGKPHIGRRASEIIADVARRLLR
ncbi:MAG: hypothetical protein OK454_03240 [Thaumarchaeota archaeon]|nr:hypothetical protein [Nitrososphaerota archaeon]